MVKPTRIAKTARPRLFGAVARPRLFQMLAENAGRPLIWVDGPPGSGKTTLVASYIDHHRIPAIWVQIDAADTDPANLFHYLSLAADGLSSSARTALPRYTAEHDHDLPRFAVTFFRQLFDRLMEGTLLVLDNYQEAAGAALDGAILAAATAVPTNGSIVCISRTPPSAVFAATIANARMFGLHWDAIRLTLEETRAICLQRGVGEDWLVHALHQQSEGWAAGITLMLERLSKAQAGTGFLPRDTRQAVFDYFASLIFDDLPEEARSVLLALAFVPYVNHSVAATISGNESAGRILESLHHRHLFVDRKPTQEPVYQFHALFRDFLQSRARAQHEPAWVRDVLVRSAQALSGDGDGETAVELLAAAEDWDGVASGIVKDARRLLHEGRHQTLERWLDRLPMACFEKNPWLAYWQGIARTQTELAPAIDSLRLALAAFRSNRHPEGEMLSLAALLNAAFIGFVGLDTMDQWLDELLACVDQRPNFASAEAELRVWGVLCSALFWIRPWHRQTEDCVSRVETLLRKCAVADAALSAAANALATASLSGAFESGDAILSMTRELAHSPAASPIEAAWWLLHAGFMRFFEARYEEALDFMDRASQVAERNGLQKTFIMATFHRVAIEFRVLGWTVAGRTLAEINSAARPRYAMAEAMLAAYDARLAHAGGRHEAAADYAERLYDEGVRTGSRYQRMLFGLIAAELMIDAHRCQRAEALLAESESTINRSPSLSCWRAPALLVRARLAHVDGNVDGSVALLRAALALARSGKGRYYFRHLDCTMPPMFMLALERGVEVSLVQQLIHMFRLRPPPQAPDLWPRPLCVATLGRFEVAINGKPQEYSRKVPRKTLALIAYGGDGVSEQALGDALWPDEEADAAKQALDITVVRLRKLLGSHEAVIQLGGKLSMNTCLFRVDCWCFEDLAERSADSHLRLRALQSYTGTFLPEDISAPWSIPIRERLRGKFIHLLASHGRSLEDAGEVAAAVELYFKGLDADPIVEAFHQGLMRCYQIRGCHTEAISVFRRLRQTLSMVLGVVPSIESQKLYAVSIAAQEEANAAPGPDNLIRLDLGERQARSRATGKRR